MRGCLIYHIKVLSFFLIYYYTIFKAYCMISVNPQRGNDIDHLYIYAACTKTLARNCTKSAEKVKKLFCPNELYLRKQKSQSLSKTFDVSMI